MAQQKSIPQFPIEIRPLQRAYVLASCWFALPPLIWLAVNRKMPSFTLLYICLGGVLLALAYVHNKTLRLDEMGITQGFSILSTFMRYDAIAEARIARSGNAIAETRLARLDTDMTRRQAITSPALVVIEENSSRRITIPLVALDRAKLYHALSAVVLVAPHARVLIDALSWISVETP